MGHASCLDMQEVQGYDVCAACVPISMLRLQRFRTEQQRREWALARESIRNMKVAWFVNLANAADAVGTVVAGAGVAAVAGAATFARSVVRASRRPATTASGSAT